MLPATDLKEELGIILQITKKKKEKKVMINEI